jgi:hopanoid biosynthesis associated RND transporter like protein HpnN
MKGHKDVLGALSALSGAVVAFACRRAGLVTAIAAVVAVLGLVFAFNNFRIDTDLDSVLDARLPWRVESAKIEAVFPDLGDDITVIIDGATPELTEQAARRLEAALRIQSNLFDSMARVNAGAFFDREGLLYGSEREVRESTQALVAAQPLLAQVTSDPSMRGLMHALELGVTGLKSDPRTAGALSRAMDTIREVLAHAADREPGFLSWQGLLGVGSSTPSEWRQFISIVPRLDHTSTTPALAVTSTVRRTAGQLGLDAAHGIHMRLTGSSVIADEELATLSESSGWIAGAVLLCMMAVLYLASRSLRVIAAILLTTSVGGVITGAIGLALVGQFTLISIAFLPLFAGLGIDFCIQLHARASAERHDMSLPGRLIVAARSIGGALSLAALAIAAAFLAFLPTNYRGVSELGLIAGIGILIALLLSLTVLPALLMIFRAPIREHPASLFWKSMDDQLLRGRKSVLVVTAVLLAIALLASPSLRFNFDPMALRNPRTEAVSSYHELARQAATTPDTVNALVADLASAESLARRLSRLPQVGRVDTLQSLIPEEQQQKLEMIAGARDLLDLTLDPFSIKPAPTESEIVTALQRTAAQLRKMQSGDPALRMSASALGAALERLAAADSNRRLQAGNLLMTGLPTALAGISESLQAQPVTAMSLPVELRRQWLAADGRARIEVAPAKPLLDARSTGEFVAAVRAVLPNATGDAVTVVESGLTVLGAFRWAGILSAIAVVSLLVLTFRSLRAVVVTLAPILLAGVLAVGTCAVLGLEINLENLIALPLLLGIGVAFNIYCVTVWASGRPIRLATSLGRGILFSALTTGTSFATLMFSAHPGTASMGALLFIALAWIVVTSLIVTPVLASQMEWATITG